MDDVDRAQARQLLDNDLALKERALYPPSTVPRLFAEDGETVLCWGCEKPIPPARLEKEPGAGMCVTCLTEVEQRRKARRER